MALTFVSKLRNILMPCSVEFINKLLEVLRFYRSALYFRCFINIMRYLFPFTIFVKQFAFICPVFIWLFHLMCSKPDTVIGILAFVETEC